MKQRKMYWLVATLSLLTSGVHSADGDRIAADGSQPPTRENGELVALSGGSDGSRETWSRQNLGEVAVSLDSNTGEARGRTSVAASPTDDPDDVYWSALGSGMARMEGEIAPLVLVLTAYDGELIAGGQFTIAGGVAASTIASWDGSNWSPLGQGMESTVYYPHVNALTVYDGKLVASGIFETAGDVGAIGMASWDGSSWSSVGSEMDGSAFALTVYDGKLIASGVAASSIASWDGISWSPLGSGIEEPATVWALTVYGNKLIAGGLFHVAGGVDAHNVAAWDGSSWSALGSGVNRAVQSLTVYNNKLIVGGAFYDAGGVSAMGVAAWDGSSWSALGAGLDGLVTALTVYDNKLIAGGYFATSGGVTVNNIASWDGFSWSALGSGVGGETTNLVYALTVYDDKLIAGGEFTTAGGKEANRIAQWSKKGCCSGRVGNANGIGTYPNEVTISDIQLLVTAKFISNLPCEQSLHCLTEADVNQSGLANPKCSDVTISDIQTVVNHLFIAGPANAPLKDCL